MAVQRFSDSDLRTALQDVASKVTGQLSVLKYDRNRTTNQPSSALIIQRSKSWSKALISAGLPHQSANKSYQSKFTLEDAISFTKKYLAQEPRPSYQNFSNWLKRIPDAPSAQTCRNLAGSWQKLKTSAKN
ncbi:MAG: hypothetical protein FJW76_03640 [Actinobacteria bacterium]|nr:hypothetical protein [Actinomycetota bacterium]